MEELFRANNAILKFYHNWDIKKPSPSNIMEPERVVEWNIAFKIASPRPSITWLVPYDPAEQLARGAEATAINPTSNTPMRPTSNMRREPQSYNSDISTEMAKMKTSSQTRAEDSAEEKDINRASTAKTEEQRSQCHLLHSADASLESLTAPLLISTTKLISPH